VCLDGAKRRMALAQTAVKRYTASADRAVERQMVINETTVKRQKKEGKSFKDNILKKVNLFTLVSNNYSGDIAVIFNFLEFH